MSYPEVDNERSSPHIGVCLGRAWLWHHLLTSGTGDSLPVSFPYADLASPSAQQNGKKHGSCGSRVQGSNQPWFCPGGSALWSVEMQAKSARGLSTRVQSRGKNEHGYLSNKTADIWWRVLLRIPCYVAAPKIFYRHIFYVEAHVVAREGSLKPLVMHLNGLYLCSQFCWWEGQNHSRLQDTSLNLTHGDCANTWGINQADFKSANQNGFKETLPTWQFYPPPIL